MASSYRGRIERIEAELDGAGGGGMIVVVADSPEEAAPLIAEQRRCRGLRPDDRRVPVVVLTRTDAAVL